MFWPWLEGVEDWGRKANKSSKMKESQSRDDDDGNTRDEDRREGDGREEGRCGIKTRINEVKRGTQEGYRGLGQTTNKWNLKQSCF